MYFILLSMLLVVSLLLLYMWYTVASFVDLPKYHQKRFLLHSVFSNWPLLLFLNLNKQGEFIKNQHNILKLRQLVGVDVLFTIPAA
jgi:hypothetical protein